jgi:CBS domain-containing protein
MTALDQGFLTLCAEDLMSRDLRVIPQDMSLQAAARILSDGQISGAPVVDGEGRCVGVLSATDFVHWARNGGKGVSTHFSEAPCVCSDWQVVDLEVLPKDEVRWHMTPGPVAVKPSASITEVARVMLEAHIHRVVVVDWMHRPVGIVTSTDVLAAVANPDGDVRKIKAATQYRSSCRPAPIAAEAVSLPGQD